MAKSIEQLVDAYKLKAGGVEFWTPYFINSRDLSPDPDKFKPGPYKGKGTPAQLQSWVDRYYSKHPSNKTDKEWREILREHGVGIECSGFVYSVLDEFLKAAGRGRLWDYIYIPRGDLLKSYDDGYRPKGVSRAQIEKYPENIVLKDFCKSWNKDPRRSTNVKRLVSDQATIQIGKVTSLKPGDLVFLVGVAGDHVGVIISNDGGVIEYADSIGYQQIGVSKYKIKITNPDLPIEKQNWGDKSWYAERYDFKGLRRLRPLNNA